LRKCLYLNDIDLHEKGFPDKQYARAIHRLVNCEEKLLGILDDEQRKLFEGYTNDQREVSVIADCASFIDGFKLGAKIMLDVLTEGEMKEL